MCQADIHELELRIDTIDPGYYTVAHGDGQAEATGEAGTDVGGHQGRARGAAHGQPPHDTAPDPLTVGDNLQPARRSPARFAVKGHTRSRPPLRQK